MWLVVGSILALTISLAGAVSINALGILCPPTVLAIALGLMLLGTAARWALVVSVVAGVGFILLGIGGLIRILARVQLGDPSVHCIRASRDSALRLGAAPPRAVTAQRRELRYANGGSVTRLQLPHEAALRAARAWVWPRASTAGPSPAT